MIFSSVPDPIAQSLAHVTSEFEGDWSSSFVPQIWRCDTKCDTIEEFFYGQSYIKYIFKPKLWQNMSFVPQFNLNLVNFLEISNFLALWGHVVNFTQYKAKTVLNIQLIV